MECAAGDWIETSTVLAPVTRVLAADLVEVYDFELQDRRVVATQRKARVVACGCGAQPRHGSNKAGVNR